MSFEALSLSKNTHEDNGSSSAVGQEGERVAADYLRRRGLILVATNFVTTIGRNRVGARVSGEIDIIALDAETICFVEVKSRKAPAFADPLSAIDLRKQRQISRTALAYLRIFGLEHMPYRFDAVSVEFHPTRAPKIEHRENYWSIAKFRKRRWSQTL